MLSLRSVYGNEKGMVLSVALMLLVILTVIGSAAVVVTRMDIKIAGNFKTGTKVLYLAEAGAEFARDAMNQGKDLDGNNMDEETQVFNTANGVNWDSSGVLNSLYAGSSGSVTIVEDPTNSNFAVITSTATFGGASNTVEIVVAKGKLDPPGAIYLPGTAAQVETKFLGDIFTISGYDTKLDGTLGACAVKPGIATNDAALTTEITDADLLNGGLAASQFDNVIGEGGPPSVITTSAFYDVRAVINDLLAYQHNHFPGGNSNQFLNGTWGTDAAPEVTYIAATAEITGSVTGSGVLIVDGTLKMMTGSSLNFHGLVIVLDEISTQLGSTVDILGMLWVDRSTTLPADKAVELDPIVGTIKLSCEALEMVNDNFGRAFASTSAIMPIISWREVK